jgi:hypothetical protein
MLYKEASQLWGLKGGGAHCLVGPNCPVARYALTRPTF